MTALLRYDAAKKAVLEAKTIDEVSSWLDKAAAVREYGRRIKDRQIELDALEIRAFAKRQRGKLILELKEQGHFPEGRRATVNPDGQLKQMLLDDYDISRAESSEEQKIAQMGEDAFTRLVARCRAYAENDPKKHSINVLKPPSGPINGARSIMGSRQEPDDSLDFFPTPPFATRALIEHVFTDLLVPQVAMQSAWEPACGEGHIAGVLKEYGVQVYATDIFDYDTEYQDRLCNFLNPNDYAPHVKPGRYDWIITNPPFGDKTIQFVLRGLEMARFGVAMFVRSQWAVEGVERYEKLFRDRPPTLCAFFVERVNLRKGCWDPKGGTATAYCWLVWVKGREPCAPFWIPPGRRKELTHDDDTQRFTSWSPDEPPHDEETGELIESEAQRDELQSSDRQDVLHPKAPSDDESRTSAEGPHECGSGPPESVMPTRAAHPLEGAAE